MNRMRARGTALGAVLLLALVLARGDRPERRRHSGGNAPVPAAADSLRLPATRYPPSGYGRPPQPGQPGYGEPPR